MSDQNKKPDICPLLSAGKFEPQNCVGERCAWYSQNDHSDDCCAVLAMADSLSGIDLGGITVWQGDAP